MDFPKHTKQKKSEAHSYAILLYKLRNLGIFRNLTDNDYGIDFELELVKDAQVTARVVKIQVKSAENLRVRADGTPSVGGIKQTTLAYWCELSYRSNVIAYAVDLETEIIYVALNLFWQSTQLIDGGNSSKSIQFIAAGEDGDVTATAATVIGALSPTASDHIYAHTLALRRLRDFLGLLDDAFHYDEGTEIDARCFEDLLEVCKIMLWEQGRFLWTDEQDQKCWTSYEYWRSKSEADNWDGLVCYSAQPILTVLVPSLVRELRRFKTIILNGKYYWSYRNPQFLGLVYKTEIPDANDKDSLLQWYRQNRHAYNRNGWTQQYILAARKPAADKAKKPSKSKI